MRFLLNITVATALLISLHSDNASAQSTSDGAVEVRVPKNRQKLQLSTNPEILSYQLRTPALQAWRNLKRTRTNQYQYLRDVADLWTFVFTCPEIDQDLAREFTPIHQYSEQIIQSIVGTYFDEEWDLLDQLDESTQAGVFSNLAKTIYAFELGARSESSPTSSASVDLKQREICKENQAKYRDLFIALKRKAVVTLRESSN